MHLHSAKTIPEKLENRGKKKKKSVATSEDEQGVKKSNNSPSVMWL